MRHAIAASARLLRSGTGCGNFGAVADEKQQSFSTGHDGKIDGIYRGKDSRRDWSNPTEEAQLELVSRPKREPPPEPPRPAPKKRSAAGPIIAVVLALLALLSPFLIRWGLRVKHERDLLKQKAAGLIFIDSHPADARVFIDGVEVGRTPYVAPNTFQPGTEVPLRIVYPGAQDWVGTLPGGVAASFTAQLEAKP